MKPPSIPPVLTLPEKILSNDEMEVHAVARDALLYVLAGIKVADCGAVAARETYTVRDGSPSTAGVIEGEP
jgi:hypothetical protein